MTVSIVCMIYQETQVAAVAEGLFDKQKSSVNLQNALEGMLLLPFWQSWLNKNKIIVFCLFFSSHKLLSYLNSFS